GVPMPFIGLNPASKEISTQDPLQSLLRLAWVSYGLPTIFSVYPLAFPVLLVVPANIYGAFLGYFFDVTIEVAGVYLPFIAFPVMLGLVELPGKEVARSAALPHTAILLSLTAVPLVLGVWLSSKAPHFPSSFAQGAIGFLAFLAVGLVVLVVVKALRGKSVG
ncbi:MAG: hypothetical protein QXX87_04335, partial [Candidatus Jordarchaeales archaeon]